MSLPSRVVHEIRGWRADNDPTPRCRARCSEIFLGTVTECLEPVDEIGKHCPKHSGCYACQNDWPPHRHIAKLGRNGHDR